MLNYYAFMKDTQPVFTALHQLDDFRRELAQECKISFHSLNNFPFFDVVINYDVDEFLDALEGLPEV